MARLPNVRLDLTNRPENVLLVRETLTGVALAIGLDGSDLSDIRTAVTEACNNVVLHAYGEQEGTLEVEISLGESLEVVVRDRGVGMAGEREEAANDPGIGLPVIEALARTVEFEETEESSRSRVGSMAPPQPPSASPPPRSRDRSSRGYCQCSPHVRSSRPTVSPTRSCSPTRSSPTPAPWCAAAT
jgi:serine/threonine-protein kinase RsbW